MTAQETSHATATQDARIKDLTEENELLFEQLHVVQEELEKYYHKLKDCERRQMGIPSEPVFFDPHLSEVLAENQKLRVLADWRQRVLRVETENSLVSLLGKILIDGVSSTGDLLSLPGQLRKTWKILKQTTPPAALGGESFQKVIDAYGTGGEEAVEKLLDSVLLSSPMRANAYKALSRHLKPIDVKKAAETARLAYETDPRPHRLRLLAFRMHDAGDPVAADALLELLPADITMSESDQQKATNIRHEATRLRKENAEKDATVQKQKKAENQYITQLIKQVEAGQREADGLRQELTKQVEEGEREANELRQKMTKQVKDLQRKADDLRNQLNKREEEKKREVDKLQQQLKKQREDGQRETNEIRQRFEKQIEKDQYEADEMRQMLTEQVKELQDELTKLRQQLIDQFEEGQRESDELRQQLADQTEELQSVADNLRQQLIKQAEEGQREADELRQQLADQTEELQSVADNLRQQLIGQAEEGQREAEKLLQQQKELQQIVNTRQAELHDLRVHLDEQKELVKAHYAEIDSLKATHVELQANANNYKVEADTLQMRLTILEKLADERKMEIDRQNVHINGMNKAYQEEIKLLTSQQKEIISAVSSTASNISNNFEKQKADLERVHESVQSSCKNEIDNALQQVVAYNGLSEYFESGKLPKVTPWKRDWPASPDFILWLVELIDQNNYDLILEFGSGITTLYTAKALAVREKKDASAKKVTAVAFEHLEQYFLQTQNLLSHAGLGECATVIHAPLQEYTAPDGTVYQYYSCQKDLAKLSPQYKSHNSRILAIVDGPPGATNKNARYPAFPLVMQYFYSAHIDFLLDDYRRNDEKELAGLWKAACTTTGIEHTIIEKMLEKEAVLLQISSIQVGV